MKQNKIEKLDITEIKQLELELLKIFIQICERYKLCYYLGGGTLLGAIRHQGFIPWDDDIDVMMPRPDYERLLCLNLQAELPEYRKLLQYRDGTLTLPYAKLADLRTSIQEGNVSRRYSQHIWIDIFPIDGNPEDDLEYHNLCQRLRRYRHTLFMGMYRMGRGSSWMKRLGKLILIPVIRLYGLKRLCAKIDQISRSYSFEQCSQVGCLVWGYGERERVDKAGFLKAEQAYFEGVLCAIPSNYDEYLTKHYGDYMQLPPEKDRICHTLTAWIDKRG